MDWTSDMTLPGSTNRMRRRGALALMCLMCGTVAGCGGDDDATPDDATSNERSGDEANDDSALADNDARDSVLDAVGDESDVDLDDAIASLSPETRYDIAAGQMDPEPSVEIDGSEIRLVFGDGTVGNAVMDCILASAIQTVDETVTLVYPDGDKVC